MAAGNPFDGRPLRVTVGARPLDLADWLLIDEHRASELAAKATLLDERHADVVATRDEGLAGSRELLALVIDHLKTHAADRFDFGAATVRDLERNVTVDLAALHPIDAAGRLVQEDVTIMSRDGIGEWRLNAASVCFPSRWSLAEKIGADLTQIHEPVPFYEERIGAAVQQFFDRLTPERPVWRMNWTLLNDASLFQPVGRPWTTGDGSFGDDLFFRVERQTLRALPVSGAIAFTIRTTVRPLGEFADVPGAFAALADTLEATNERTVEYKGWSPICKPLVDWLRASV